MNAHCRSGISSSTTIRTGVPVRRSSTDSSTAVSRSSASSSSISRSAFLVTRNGWTDTTFTPGKSRSTFAAIMSSRKTNSNRSPGILPAPVPGTAIRRGKEPTGTLRRANRVWPSQLRTSTARLSERFEMNGNGCEASKASGVSAGKISAWKRSRSRVRISGGSSATRRTPIPARSSAGSRSSVQHRRAVSRSGASVSRIATSCCAGLMPSGGVSTTPSTSCRWSPDTLIMKNSSRLLAKIARNLIRSRSGFR